MFMPAPLFPRLVLNVSLVDDYNVFTAAGSPSGPVRVVVKIASGAEIGSTSTSTAGFIFGSGWHIGAKIEVICNGTIMGKGGQGGTGEGASVCTPIAGVSPTAGGPAIDATGLPAAGMVKFTNNGTIAGGGGGGGFGGAGCVPSASSWGGGGGGSGRGKATTAGGPGGPASGSSNNFPGSPGGSGTSAVPGAGGLGGSAQNDTGGGGGDFGATGGTGLANGAPYNAGAAAGAATLGDSKINFVVVGTITGTRSG